jgi:YidC/Oxa1 family membrane protein insertase
MNNDYQKRMMIVFVLSFLMIIGTFYFLPKKTVENVPAATNVVVPVANSAAIPAAPLLLKELAFKSKGKATNINISYRQEIEVDVNSQGARIEKLFVNGKWNRQKLPVSLLAGDSVFKPGDMLFGSMENLETVAERPVFSILEAYSNKIVLAGNISVKGSPLEIRESYTVTSNYQFIQEISIKNNSSYPLLLDFNGKSFAVGTSYSFFSKEKANPGNLLVAQYFDGQKLHQTLNSGLFKGPDKSSTIANPVWLSIHDNYFLAFMKPVSANVTGRYILVKNDKSYQEIAFGFEFPAFSLAKGESKSFQILHYIGPKKESIAGKIDPTYRKLFEWPAVFNWLMKPIELLLTNVMSFLSIPIANWGIIIILLSLLIKLVLAPLSIKAAISVKRTNLLQPKIKNLQEKYKEDQKVLNEKLAELYKKEGVNPLGGCFPILLQIPVFFALYRVLSSSVELKGASFLWIKDLTQPDTLFAMSIPFLPASFNLLPIIMTGVQIVSMKLQSMKTTANTQQTAINTYLLPVVFLFLFWSMPSGLVLYWTVQNLYTILEQEVVNLDRQVKLK